MCLDMTRDGVRADDETLGDLPIGPARRQMRQHLELAGRQCGRHVASTSVVGEPGRQPVHAVNVGCGA